MSKQCGVKRRKARWQAGREELEKLIEHSPGANTRINLAYGMSRNDVQQAIDNKLFNIWLVDNVSDATQLLLDKNLEDSKNNIGIISLIEHRLDDSNIKKSIFSKIKRFFLNKN